MLLFYLSLPFYLKSSNFLYWMVPYTPKYILTKFWDAKIDIFDIIEKNVILCVLEMSALGTTLTILRDLGNIQTTKNSCTDTIPYTTWH